MPTRQPDESTDDFISRCMDDGKMKQEFSDEKQRYAVCRSYAEGSEEANLEKTDDAVSSSMSCSCSGNIEQVEARSSSLPEAPRGRPWDGPGAAKRMLDAATSDDKINKSKASRGFTLIRGDPQNRGSYILPFADVIDGSVHVVYRGVVAALGALSGARGGVKDISDSERKGAVSFLEGQRGRFGEDKEAAQMTPSDDETHDDFMKRCMDAGNSEEECMAFHEGHVFPEAATCPPGEKMVDGYCTPVSVTMDLDVGDITSIVEAATGRTIMKISGIAFHEGVNKNSWALTREGAMATIDKIKGKDLTLKHPSIEGGRFTRNMDGGVEEATVGVVTDASFHDEEGGWVVRYEAEVHRPELFEALDSGLWLRPEYGVSIGGTGVPTKVVSYEDGTNEMWFGEDFELDHLAIVHRPAYPKANIEKVEVIEVEMAETFIRDSDDTKVQSEMVNNMSDDIENNEMIAEIEALKAEMVLRDARINEFEAIEQTRIEEKRESLVEKATELGLAGHDEFSIETLEKVIASWESSRPEPTPEPEVEMLPATPAATEMVEASVEPTAVIANYLNGEMVETDEDLYSRAYNAWVAAYNQTVDRDSVKAQKFEEIKEMI